MEGEDYIKEVGQDFCNDGGYDGDHQETLTPVDLSLGEDGGQ